MAKSRDISGLEEVTNTSTPKGNDYLLGIGIDAYTHFTPLHNAVKDIQDISNLLTEDFGFSKEGPFFKTLLNETATRQNIIRALKQICKIVKPEDRVLIYYSGHGYLDPFTDRGYWIPANAEKDDDAAFVANSTIRDYIKAMKSRHTLLISDSCFSGSLLVRDASRNIESAFKQWESRKSRWLFCSGKGVVSDGQKGHNSPFAKQIIRHLKDASQEYINIARLADEVTTSVSFNYEQLPEASPFHQTGHDGGQFIFYRKKIKEVDKLTLFEKVKESKNKEMLIDFLTISKNISRKKEIRKILKTLELNELWTNVNKKSYADLDEFVEDNPRHPEVEKAKLLMFQLRNTQSSKQIIHPSNTIINKPHIVKDSNLFIDQRDRQEYKTIKLKDGNIWLGQNLNYDIGEGSYNKNYRNGKQYGRLYTWEASLKACPIGWHLPSMKEWIRMATLYGGYNNYNMKKIIGDPKKSYSALIEGGNSGFEALDAGVRYSDGSFGGSIFIYFWTSEEYDSIGSSIVFNMDTGTLRQQMRDKMDAHSCRYIKD